MSKTTCSRSHLALLCGLGLGLSGGGAALAGSATFATSLGDHPCEIVTASMVATALNVPVADLEQKHLMTSRCSYEMEEGGKFLKVGVSLKVYETDEDAAEDFRAATRSMSADEISEGMKLITAQADKDGASDSGARKEAADSIGAGLLRNGIQFEDVDGVADQARLETSDGTLHLQQGNLRIKLRAFYGPAMPIPDKITQETMTKALTGWQQNTMDLRRAQAMDLAELALAPL